MLDTLVEMFEAEIPEADVDNALDPGFIERYRI